MHFNKFYSYYANNSNTFNILLSHVISIPLLKSTVQFCEIAFNNLIVTMTTTER